jgi:ribosomal protein L9
LAVLADKDSLNGYKAKMASATRHKEKKTEGYTSLFKQIIDDNGIQFSMKTNEKGILYEKIDAVHIANRIKELYAVDIEDHFFKMKKKITQTGEYTIVFQYNTIEKDVHVVVKSENNKHITEKVEEVVAQIA